MVAGEGVRSSTPGKGARQWTSAGTSIHESAMFNTGIAVPRSRARRTWIKRQRLAFWQLE